MTPPATLPTIEEIRLKLEKHRFDLSTLTPLERAILTSPNAK